MIANLPSLTRNQIDSFDRLLMNGTERTLYALETIFGLNIESSDSCIELASANQSESLKHLGTGPVYTISSNMVGDIRGNTILLLRSDDLRYLSKVMGPTLSLLFLSRPGDGLAQLDSQKPDWMKNNDPKNTDKPDYHAQMMDTLAEMANVITGLYGKAIYQMCNLNTRFSLPRVLMHRNQEVLREILSSSSGGGLLHLVIQNDFFVMDKPIKLWCLISPTRESFQEILKRVEYQEEYSGGSLRKPIEKQVIFPFFDAVSSAKRTSHT